MSMNTSPDIAPRLDALLDAHGARDDATVAALWRAMSEDARAVYDNVTLWLRGFWVSMPSRARPPFHDQPWAPRRRRQRKTCRR